MAVPQNLLPPIGTATGNVTSDPGAGGGGAGGAGGRGGNIGSNSGVQTTPNARPPPPPLDTMRAYRACLNCRNRKSKCDLDMNQGRPPCRRCQRENKECVLGESHRGGRRVRKKPKLDEGDTKSPATPTASTFSASAGPTPHYSPLAVQQPLSAQSYRYDNRQEPAYTWQQPPPTAGSIPTSASRLADNTHLTAPDQYRQRNESIISVAGRPGQVHEGIASADLQNPSDALEILARVADRADDENSASSDQTAGRQKLLRPVPRSEKSPSRSEDQWHYKPLRDGLISPEMVTSLFQSYEELFHPYFPIIPRQTFDRYRLPWLSRHEPHLFSAILTVASKDNEDVHQICYEHMQQLISMILAGSDANVEAVEALLLLSQWVSHRPQASIAVGRGEEDRVAWMYVGTALRLAYYLGIDRTSFKSDVQEDPAKFNRKRLVWAACYICDRQVSVRVGKGFWARGPGPLSGLKSSDFPTLQPVSSSSDNYALIFQANLELTQIFSNVHDILYSSKGYGWKEMLEGRYAKHLDDFRYAIRSWNDVWGAHNCSPRLRTQLLLTYDYLRLYVNAFAYQATISRALTFQKDASSTSRPMPLINATAPDARFIYEAVDAAKSLLSTFNNFVDPMTLRYMPSTYYLFIIYSAVFLYKARSTTTMTEEERLGVKNMINMTIERLQKASVGANHMGSRYARLLQLLWRKNPRKSVAAMASRQPSIANPNLQIDPALTASEPNTNPPANSAAATTNNNHNPAFDPSLNYNMMGNGFDAGVAAIAPSGFSWLDLGATWNFATQGGTGTGTGSSGGSTGEFDDLSMGGGVNGEMSPFDVGFLGGYNLAEGDGGNLIF